MVSNICTHTWLPTSCHRLLFPKAEKFTCACAKHPGFRKGAKTANKMIAAKDLDGYGQDGCIKCCSE